MLEVDGPEWLDDSEDVVDNERRRRAEGRADMAGRVADGSRKASCRRGEKLRAVRDFYKTGLCGSVGPHTNPISSIPGQPALCRGSNITATTTTPAQAF